MCKCFITILSLTITIISFVYLIRVYKDSEIDTFQKPFGFEEKKKLFMNPSDNPNKLLKYKPIAKPIKL